MAGLQIQRRILCLSAASGKGFGGKKEKPPAKSKAAAPLSARREEGVAVEKILEKLESSSSGKASEEAQQGTAGPRSATTEAPRGAAMLSRVDPAQAARGRVDYVRVEGWEPYVKGGSSTITGDVAEADADSLGNLPVRSFSPGAAVMPDPSSPPSVSSGKLAGAEGSSGGAGQRPAALPFYEQLVRHLQLLDSKGELAVARPKNAGPLPPFEKWNFGDERFLQYLVDVHAVHVALEESIAQALSVSRPDSANGTGITSGSQGEILVQNPIAKFGPSLGLHRSSFLMQDIEAIRTELSTQARAAGLEQLGSRPSTQASALASYISSIAKAFTMPEPLGYSIADLKKGRQGSMKRKVRKAELRLIANLFAIHVANLTTGMRIGAKAMECAPAMRKARALRFFQEFPAWVGDPLKVFIASIDSLGEVLDDDDKDVIIEELPKSVVKTSLLMSVLACEESAAGV